MPKGAFDNTITYAPPFLRASPSQYPGRPLASATLLLWIGLAHNKKRPHYNLLQHYCYHVCSCFAVPGWLATMGEQNLPEEGALILMPVAPTLTSG